MRAHQQIVDGRAQRAILALAATLMAACGSDDEPAAAVATSGSTTLLPLVHAVLETPAAQASGIAFEHSVSHSGQGLRDLIEGSADIARMSRPVRPRERQLARAAGVPIRTYTIAKGAIAIIVHPSRRGSIKAQSTARVRRIFFTDTATARPFTWLDLGGPEADPVQCVAPNADGGTGSSFRELLGVENDTQYPRGTEVHPSTHGVLQSVASNRNAIGLAPLALVDDSVHMLPLLLQDGTTVIASPESVRRGRYPLHRPLNLILRQPASDQAQLLVEWALSDAGQQAIAASGCISLRDPR